ncbi:MAG: cytochrome c-type biogenesis protein CcmI [Alteromonadaceae bacterium]|jgi:cytochrome c-type biogenesis protein CcmI
MLNFYLITAGLLVSALLCWFLAVRMQSGKVVEEQKALAREQVNTYQLRLRELSFEKDRDELDDKEYEASVIDLKRQLLHDVSGESHVAGNSRFSLIVPPSAFLLFFVVAFYGVNGQLSQLDDMQTSIALLPALGERAVLNKGEELSAKELQQLALGLRVELHKDDTDAVAWLLLGQVTQALNDFDSAMQAFEMAYKLDPAKVTTLVNYAQILLMRGGHDQMKRAAYLLSKVLIQQPEHIDALLMVGYIAEQMGDIDKAKASWERLVVKLDKADQRLAFVQQKLREMTAAQIVAGNPSFGVDLTDSSVKGSGRVVKITVHLSLSEALLGKVPAGATLFVYAKAAKGPPMPAAVVKMNTFELPLTVDLSDANAMMDNYKLSDLNEVVISTRISHDSNIAVSAGELQGQSQVLRLSDTSEVSVVINQVL